MKALPVTIGLNFIAIIIIYVVSIPLGVYAAVKRNGLFDQVSSIVLFLLYSIPNFWLASLLIMFFATVPCWLHESPLPPDGLCTELSARADSDSEWSTDATYFCDDDEIEDRDEIQTASVCLDLHESYSDFDQCRTDLRSNMDEVLGDKPRYEALAALDDSVLPPKDKAAIAELIDLSDGAHWDVLPSGGLESLEAASMSYLDWLIDRLKHLFLPLLVMTYAGFASLSRYARTTMLETIQENYVRTARAKGLSERIVVYKHAFRNSLITIVTLMGNLLPAMIGGSVIVEYIFNIQGMGLLGFDAILQRDYPVIMAITSFSAFLTLLGILLSDILYSVVDPRVSQE
jgi:ABC-type dipeptide/oligopeptide/nickel transport system permease component